MTGRWERLQAAAPLAAVLGITFAGAIVVSAVSYQHEYHLAHGNGQAPWVSSLLPFTVDGVIFVASIALLWASANSVRGWRRLWQPRGVLAVGMAATIAANLYSDLHYRWLGPAVAASSGVSLILISAVAFWLLGEQRKVAQGENPQQAAACSCQPPPVSLAEALPLARARLKDLGELHGEEALADRFGTTRHKVRAVLVPAVKDPPAGMPAQGPPIPAGDGRGRDGSDEIGAPAVPATMNGHRAGG